jgi:hypothetical protein
MRTDHQFFSSVRSYSHLYPYFFIIFKSGVTLLQTSADKVRELQYSQYSITLPPVNDILNYTDKKENQI